MSANTQLIQAVVSLLEPVSALESSECILFDHQELEYARLKSENDLREAKAEFEKVLNEKKIIDEQLSKERLAEADEQLKAARKKHLALNNRKRVIKEQRKLLASRDDIEELLYDELTEEKKNIDAQLKDIDEEIAESTKIIERESKLIEIYTKHREDTLKSMETIKADVDYVSDANLKKAGVDIRVKFEAAKKRVFDCLESDRKLITEHEIIGKLYKEEPNATYRKKIVSDLSKAKRSCFDILD